MSTRRSTRSRARAGSRSSWPEANPCSIARFWPSTYPIARSFDGRRLAVEVPPRAPGERCPAGIPFPLAAPQRRAEQQGPPPPRSRGTCGDLSLDDLVCPRQQRRRDRQPERFGGLEVDDQLELGGLLDREIGGFGSSEDLVDVARGASLHLGCIDSIGHKAPWFNKHPELVDCGDSMRGGKIDDSLSMHEHKGWRRDHDPLVVILLHIEEGGSQISRSAHDERMNFYAEAPSRDSYLFIVPSAYRREGRGRDVLSKERSP